MLNKTLKSIAAVLISLAVLAGSVPAVVAAEITEPAVTEPVVTEPVVTEPIVTEPVPGETTLPVDNSGELSSDPTVTDPSMTDPITDPAVIDPALPGARRICRLPMMILQDLYLLFSGVCFLCTWAQMEFSSGALLLIMADTISIP